MSDKVKKIEKEKDKFPVKCAVIPEQTAITAIKRLKFDPHTASCINSGDLLEEIFKQSKEVQEGDLSRIERYLYAQAIALDAMFDRMLAQIMGSDFTPQIQLFGTLALKAQAQCRVTLATLAQIKNPDQTTFIKQLIQQQNNAINQQVNNTSIPENLKKNEKIANELLSEAKHETLEFRRAQETISINPAVETMEAINRSKIV